MLRLLQLELVGSRLLGSLMGEWGLLHQLQGLVAVSLLASPTMVEWCEAAFATAEAALEAKRQHNKKARPGSPGRDRAAAAGARLAAGGGVGGGPSVVLGADELDVVELELLLQVRHSCLISALTGSCTLGPLAVAHKRPWLTVCSAFAEGTLTICGLAADPQSVCYATQCS